MTKQHEKKINKITPDIDRMIKAFSFNLFQDSKNDPEYPYKTYEEQYQECTESYENGMLTYDFLKFAVD